MNLIDQKLGNGIAKDLDITYPKMEAGGRVAFRRDGSRGLQEDTTHQIFHGLTFGIEDFTLPCRAHKRFAVSPVGKRMHTINSVNKFLTVICDALRCHFAIVDHCKICHRDFSDGNILVVWGQNGLARGLLTDFDNASWLNPDEDQVSRLERTGTMPFISLVNLVDRDDIPQTPLDECESAIYVSGWWGIIGLKEKCRRGWQKPSEFPIIEWSEGTKRSIITTKAQHLGSASAFKSNVLNNFHTGKESDDEVGSEDSKDSKDTKDSNEDTGNKKSKKDDDFDKHYNIKDLKKFVGTLRDIIFKHPEMEECGGHGIGIPGIAEARASRAPIVHEDDSDMGICNDEASNIIFRRQAERKRQPSPDPFKVRAEKWEEHIWPTMKKFVNKTWRKSLARQERKVNVNNSI